MPNRLIIRKSDAFCVTNFAGAPFDHWIDHVHHLLDDVRLNPQGLGAALSGENDAPPIGQRDPALEADANDWCNQVNKVFDETPLAQIELRLKARAKDPIIDQGYLGTYHRGQEGPVITLYPDAIETAAASYGYPWVELASKVLRHELGHHASFWEDEEEAKYDSRTANAATCRLETAAQLFAWLTGNAESRNLIAHFAEHQPTAYSVYKSFLSHGSGGNSLGWMSAWQFSQYPREAFVLLPEANLQVHQTDTMRNASASICAQLVTAGACPWPIISAAASIVGFPAISGELLNGHWANFTGIGSMHLFCQYLKELKNFDESLGSDNYGNYVGATFAAIETGAHELRLLYATEHDHITRHFERSHSIIPK